MNEVIRCTVKPAIVKKMFLMSSLILVPLSLALLRQNLYVSVALTVLYAAALYFIRNVEAFHITDEGVYVCRRNGSVIYGFKYSEIDRVDIAQAGNGKGLLLLHDNSQVSRSLTIRDESKIIVPEYVLNYIAFLDLIDCRIPDKLSNEVREYIKDQRSLH